MTAWSDIQILDDEPSNLSTLYTQRADGPEDTFLNVVCKAKCRAQTTYAIRIPIMHSTSGMSQYRKGFRTYNIRIFIYRKVTILLETMELQQCQNYQTTKTSHNPRLNLHASPHAIFNISNYDVDGPPSRFAPTSVSIKVLIFDP